jgi:hypothetical protein
MTRWLIVGAVLACAEQARAAHVYGTLLWIDDAPAFPARWCEGMHTDTPGLADVVVIAEPLDPAAREHLLARHSDDHAELEWDENRALRVATVSPRDAIDIRNETGRELTLRVSGGGRLLETVKAPPSGTITLSGLPAGLVHIVSNASVEGWVYVTPFPATVTTGNCRYSFDVPAGRYRVRGWHPYAGERSITVAVSTQEQSVVSWEHAANHGRLGPLVFDRQRQR